MTRPADLAVGPLFRFTGPITDLTTDERCALLNRATDAPQAIRDRTAMIVQSVRTGGDAQLRQLARELDGIELPELSVSIDHCRSALEAIDPALRRAMQRSRDNIAAVHRAFHPAAISIEVEPGVTIGRRPDAYLTAGVYAPGGRAWYPSSVLMGAVAARAAGVKTVILCSPPCETGLPSAPVLAAAALAEVDAVFAVGGAGAIAAMAFGTRTITRVDVLVGPGNAYVAEAKRQVAEFVATDAPAGPSELLVIADASADPIAVAHEVLAQAEHDPRAAVIVVCVGGLDLETIFSAIAALLPGEPRRAIIGDSLLTNGALLTAGDYDEAVAFAADYAPEHLLLAVEAPRQAGLLAAARNAGTVFLGTRSSVSFGDYMTGANHVLPTGGLARRRSGLSPFDFLRWTTWQRVDARGARSLAGDVGVFAAAEGLPAHARAALQWEKT